MVGATVRSTSQRFNLQDVNSNVSKNLTGSNLISNVQTENFFKKNLHLSVTENHKNQQKFICSKSAKETLEKGVIYSQYQQ